MIVIINYQVGNLRSVYNALRRMTKNCLISSEVEHIDQAAKLILPGVGHFKSGMQNLSKLGLVEILNKKVLIEKTPILGICLGTQLFTKHSEEGDIKGLAWIDAEVVKFNVSDKIKYKVPHIGWNNVLIKNHNSLDKVISNEDHFYFVHSYHLKCNNPSDIWMTTTYDYEFVSAIHHGNIYGTQFHPEKSHDVGNSFLKKFLEL